MPLVRFGIVGVGGMGGGHARYMNSVPGAKLAAICDNNPQVLSRVSAELDVPGFEHHQLMFASGLIDAVLIATPHYDHPPIAIDAFAAGLHVLSEKPVAVTVGAARKLNSVALQYPQLKFGVMFQKRVASLWQKMRDIISEGDLGEITRISLTQTDWFRGWAYYASGGWRATWSGEGGGVLLNQCPHTLDLLHWVPGIVPERITAITSIAKRHPIEVEDEVSAILEYKNGAIGHFTTTTGEAPGVNRFEIAGENGLLIAENDRLLFRKLRNGLSHHLQSPVAWPSLETWEISIPHAGQPESHRLITLNFVEAILFDKPLIAPGIEGVTELEIGNAMLLAGVARQSQSLPLDAERYQAFLTDLTKRYGGRKKPASNDGPIATDPKFARSI